MQALDDGEPPFVAQRDDVPAAFIHEGARLERCVLVFVFVGDVVERAPGAQIGPAKVHAQHVDILRFFHHAVIDGDIRAVGEILVNERMLLRRIEDGAAQVETGCDFRQVLVERVENRLHIPEEDTGIPEEFAAFVENFSKLQIRFLGERLDFGEPFRRDFATLDIAIACFRTAGTDAHREERVVRLDKI